MIILQLLRKHPIITNSILYGSLYAGAEFGQQTLSRKLIYKEKNSYDVRSIINYALYGTGVLAPMYFIWYKWLDGKFTGATVRTVTCKLIIDQLLVAPPMLAVFFIGMSIMEGKEDCLEEVKKKWPQAYLVGCGFWLPAQILNFYFLPSHWRVAYVGSCNFLWVNFLCYFKRKEM